MIKQDLLKYTFQIDSRSRHEYPVRNVNAICWRANDVFTLDTLNKQNNNNNMEIVN